MTAIVENVVLIAVAVAALTGAAFITKEECPENEEYLLCGSSCPFNCSSPEGPVSCGDDCVEGCFCKSGYLRNENGSCVTADQCWSKNSSICDDDEEFLSCGTACPVTCSNPEPTICGLSCSMGCFCKSGYVRDEASRKCVTLDQCPVVPCLNPNEVYDICSADCQPTCAVPEPICNKICSGGCVCAPGLLRNDNNECVSVEKCGNTTTTEGLLDQYLNVIRSIIKKSNNNFDA